MNKWRLSNVALLWKAFKEQVSNPRSNSKFGGCIIQSVHWVNQRDNQPVPLIRAGCSASQHSAQETRFSLLLLWQEALKSFIRTLLLGAPLESVTHLWRKVTFPVYHYYIPVHSNSIGHYIIFHTNCYHIDYIGSLHSLSHLPSLYWGFTTFPILLKLASYLQWPFKDAGCIQKPKNIQTKNLMFMMTCKN